MALVAALIAFAVAASAGERKRDPGASPLTDLCLRETAWWGWEDSNF
jgi:hypothetical protein